MKQTNYYMIALTLIWTAHLFSATQVTIPISIGDLVDKITILEVKLEKIDDPKKLANIRHELQLLSEVLELCIPGSTQLDEQRTELKKINNMLWNIEDSIRAKEAHNEFDIEFIAIARSVYINNGRRHDIKRAINMLSGSSIIEEKQYTQFEMS